MVLKKKFDSESIKTIGVFVEKELLGEGLLKLPFLRALRESFPHAHITWIVGIEKSVYTSALKPLTEGLVDNVLENIFFSKMRWRYLFCRRVFKKHPFDMLINTERNLKKTFILKVLPHKHFIGSLWNFFFSTLKPLEKKSPRHLTEKLLLLAEVSGQKKQKKSFAKAFIPKNFSHEVSSIFDKKKKYVGFAPGAGDQRKCWPLERFVEVASHVLEKGCTPVFILGPQEKNLYLSLKEKLPMALFPLQDHPAFLSSPLYTIALASHFIVGLANDSGTGHLFAAAGIPIISLFGHTKAEKVHPYATEVHCIKSQDLGSSDIKSIPVEVVSKKLDHILGSL